MEMTEKIEVIVQPIKKIIIFECTKLSNEEFFQRIELLARTGQPVVLNWAEEILWQCPPSQLPFLGSKIALYEFKIAFRIVEFFAHGLPQSS